MVLNQVCNIYLLLHVTQESREKNILFRIFPAYVKQNALPKSCLSRVGLVTLAYCPNFLSNIFGTQHKFQYLNGI